MDKIQEKLVELDENLSALEVCLMNGSLGYTELILFLQDDKPLEENSEMYAKMKKIFCEKFNEYDRCPTEERAEAIKVILHRLEGFIALNNSVINQPHEDYGEAVAVAEKICNLIDARKKPTHQTVPYPKKAAR